MTAQVDKLRVRCRSPQSRLTTSCACFSRTPTGCVCGVPVKTVKHPIAVGELLTDDGQPPTVVVAGLLHDALEDTDVMPAELHTRFGPDIARLVEALTQDMAIVNYRERKAALRRQILDAGPEAAIVCSPTRPRSCRARSTDRNT